MRYPLSMGDNQIAKEGSIPRDGVVSTVPRPGAVGRPREVGGGRDLRQSPQQLVQTRPRAFPVGDAACLPEVMI
jgi:hypothetical protein